MAFVLEIPLKAYQMLLVFRIRTRQLLENLDFFEARLFPISVSVLDIRERVDSCLHCLVVPDNFDCYEILVSLVHCPDYSREHSLTKVGLNMIATIQ